MVTLVAHWEQRWPDVGLRCLRLWPIQCFSNYTHKVLYLWSCLSREELMRLSLANHMANAPLSSWISTPPSFRLPDFSTELSYHQPHISSYLIINDPTRFLPQIILSHGEHRISCYLISYSLFTMTLAVFNIEQVQLCLEPIMTNLAFLFFFNGQFEEDILPCLWGPLIASKICCSPRNI